MRAGFRSRPWAGIDVGSFSVKLLATQPGVGGHRYWLAELHRRKALLLSQAGAPRDTVLRALVESLETAASQNAIPLLIGAFEALERMAVSIEMVSRYQRLVDRARRSVEPGEPLVLNPETGTPRSPILCSG